jgi:hypothetical protein
MAPAPRWPPCVPLLAANPNSSAIIENLERNIAMQKDTVLSLSPNKAALDSRESALRSRGMKVISVMSPIQARFEIEMGRCGVLLICYRLSGTDANYLAKLFRKSCPDGIVVFVTEPSSDHDLPPGTDFVVPESAGPELIVQALQGTPDSQSSAA